MKKSKAPEANKTRIFKLEAPIRGQKIRRGKTIVIRQMPEKSRAAILSMILALLAALALIPVSYFLLGPQDYLLFLFWLLSSLLVGVAVYPLSLKLFKRHPSLAFLFSLPLGLSLISFTLWTLSYLQVLKFNQGNALLVSALWALLAYANPKTLKPTLLSFFRPTQWRSIFLSIAGFGLALLFMSFVRGLTPSARGLEKFMDYGFMMSLWRTDYLPAADLWFSGHSINYYYFGQYVYTFVAKLAGVQPEFAYNLGMASTFAYFISLAYGLGHLLLSIASRQSKHVMSGTKTALWRSLAGLFTALFASFSGNSHDFFISPIAPAKALLQSLAQGSNRFGDLDRYHFPDATRFIGYNPDTVDKTIHEFPYYSFLVGDLHAHLINTVFVLFFIGLMLLLIESPVLIRYFRTLRTKSLFLPLSNYSLPVSNRFTTLCYSRFTLLGRFFKAWISSGLLPLASLMLGLFMMGNFWDFPIYWVVMAFFLTYLGKRSLGAQSHWLSFPLGLMQLALIFIPFLFLSDLRLQSWGFLAAVLFSILLYLIRPGLWTSVGLSLNLSFVIAHWLIIPFNLAFSPMAKELAIVPHHTPLYQLIILYGPQALLSLLFTLSLVSLMVLRYKKAAKAHTFSDSVDAALIEQACSETKASNADEKAEVHGRIWLNNKSLLPNNYKDSVDKRVKKLSKKRSKAVARRSLVRRFQPAGAAIILLFICAFGLILAPEFVYVRDIYENGYARANTMFKFSYQASLLLGLALPSCVFVLAHALRLQGRLNTKAKSNSDIQIKTASLDKTAGIPLDAQISDSASQLLAKADLKAKLGLRPRKLARWPYIALLSLMILLLSAPMVYPFAATFKCLPRFSLENYKGLNASVWMKTAVSDQIKDSFTDRTLQSDWEMIQWLNAQVSGQPTIVEANGLSYTDFNRVSAYTGLPTILGWQTHEWLWRTTADGANAYTTLVSPREMDVRAIYTTQNESELRYLLKSYEVKYIIIGDLERSAYPEMNETLLLSIGEKVFRFGSSLVIELL